MNPSSNPIFQVTPDGSRSDALEVNLHLQMQISNTSKMSMYDNSTKKKKQRNCLSRLFCWCGSTVDADEVQTTGRTAQIENTTAVNLKLSTATPVPPPAPTYGARRFPGALLPPQISADYGKKTLVLDLDETLVHSSFKPVPHADFMIPVEIEGVIHQVYVRKRPRVDAFLQRMGELYEVVVFTASLAKYADPVMDLLDKHKCVRTRLFREHCANHLGNYVKDLSKLGRDLTQVLIIDNSPASYLFQPQNAVPISSWFDDDSDLELDEITPLLVELARCDNVYKVLGPRQAKPYYQAS